MNPSFDVTVCIPTYEGAAYLDECLRSVEAQDLDGVEVLLTDDGSTDETLAIADAHCGSLPTLRIERNPSRLGAVGNLNRSIDLARGAWIKPLFQDDLLEPGCLSTMRAARAAGVPAVVCARSYLYAPDVPAWRREACALLLDGALDRRFGSGPVDAGSIIDLVVGSVTGAPMGTEGSADVPMQVNMNLVGEPVAVLLEREAILAAGGFDDAYVQLWDYELVHRLGVEAGLVVVAEVLAVFRVHESSATARNFAVDAYRTEILDPLRLLVAYATEDAYSAVRRRAGERTPPVDLVAVALDEADAARHRLESVDDGADGEMANSAWLDVVSPLPPRPAGASGEPDPVEAPRAGFGRLSRLVRGGQWWAHMVGPIVSLAYLQIGWRDTPPGTGVARLAALLASATALAAYGHVVNDAWDVVPDKRAGKPNALARLTVFQRIGLAVAFAVAGAVPWAFVPLGTASLALLAAIYLLPLLYSGPPTRLKERHVLGLVVDAANAFVVPGLFTMSLFADTGRPAGPAPLMGTAVVLWTTGYGLRSILVHQLQDLDNDRRSGTRTFAGEVGLPRVRILAGRVLFPTELAGLALLGATVACWSWGGLAAGLAYLMVFHAARRLQVVGTPIAPLPVANGYVSLMEWYDAWPALIVGTAVAVGQPWYATVVGVHLLLFHGPVRKQVTDFLSIGRATSLRVVRALRRRLPTTR